MFSGIPTALNNVEIQGKGEKQGIFFLQLSKAAKQLVSQCPRICWCSDYLWDLPDGPSRCSGTWLLQKEGLASIPWCL